MRKIAIILIGAVVVGTATALADAMGQGRHARQEPPNLAKSAAAHFVLLPGSKKGTKLRLCSRRGSRVDGSWNVTQLQIAALEANVKRISSLREAGSARAIRITHPEDCYRQYVAVVVAGRKLIYVNAFSGIEVPGWRSHFVTICDGGETVWGVLYDPVTGKFSDLEVNGVA